MGRIIRSTLPTFDLKLKPKLPEIETLRRREDDSRKQQKISYDKRHRVIPLPQLKPDAEVNITTHHEQGTILKLANTPRSYYVQTPTKVIRRNREHIIPFNTGTPEKSPNVQKQATSVKTPEMNTELNILTRPTRTIKPTLKVLENFSLT